MILYHPGVFLSGDKRFDLNSINNPVTATNIAEIKVQTVSLELIMS